MQINSLHDMLVHELKGMYYVETELVDELDEMAADATNDKLSKGFADHREETQNQVERLEQAFRALDMEPETRDHAVMDGLRQEKQEFLDATTDDDLRDLFYMSAGKKTERMEITSYEGMKLIATRMDDIPHEVTEAIDANLDEEEATLREIKGMAGASGVKSMLDRLVS